MNEFKRAREDYEAAPIPQELEERVRAGVRQGKANYRRRRWRKYGVGAAACLAVLVAALNLSPAVAAAAADVPVLGGLFRVMTFISYNASDGGINYLISVPRLETEGNSEAAQAVNEAIQNRVTRLETQARRDWEDYKEAFFATGGTEEEWAGRTMDVIVEYEVKSQTDTRVSFVVTFAEGWVASMEERYCYNLDLAEDRDITLEELLGENWVERCNEAVRSGIAASVDEEGFTYFFSPEEGGFTTVDETTSFYIREDGVPVLVFPEYSIAAGAAGSPEFPVE